MANDVVPFYEPGTHPTCSPSGAGGVTGGTFVAISGDRNSDGLIQIATAAADALAFGVAAHDAAQGGRVKVFRGQGVTLPMTADGAISANQLVEVGTNGNPTARTTGVPVGLCVHGAADGEEVQITLTGAVI